MRTTNAHIHTARQASQDAMVNCKSNCLRSAVPMSSISQSLLTYNRATCGTESPTIAAMCSECHETLTKSQPKYSLILTPNLNYTVTAIPALHSCQQVPGWNETGSNKNKFPSYSRVNHAKYVSHGYLVGIQWD